MAVINCPPRFDIQELPPSVLLPILMFRHGRSGTTVDSLLTDTPRFDLRGIGYEGVSGLMKINLQGQKSLDLYTTL